MQTRTQRRMVVAKEMAPFSMQFHAEMPWGWVANLPFHSR